MVDADRAGADRGRSVCCRRNAPSPPALEPLRSVQSRLPDGRPQRDRFDFVEPDYRPPIAGRGIVAQITPTQAQLGVAFVYTYVLLPEFDSPTQGFNRLSVAVPSMQTRLSELSLDSQPWVRVETPRDLEEAGIDWLQGLDLDQHQQAVAAVVSAGDLLSGSPTLALKLPAVGPD